MESRQRRNRIKFVIWEAHSGYRVEERLEGVKVGWGANAGVQALIWAIIVRKDRR